MWGSPLPPGRHKSLEVSTLGNLRNLDEQSDLRVAVEGLSPPHAVADPEGVSDGNGRLVVGCILCVRVTLD